MTALAIASPEVPSAPPRIDLAAVSRVQYRFPSGAEWWDAVGRVPMERVVFDPLPGTATVADVVRLDERENVLCELVFGTLVRKTVGYPESLIGGNFFAALHAFVKANDLGLVAPADGMMRLLGRQVRIPDVSFVSKESLPDGEVPTEPVPDLVPDLAVEVISASNTPREMQNKLREYFEAGTRLVWYVDLADRVVTVYTSPEDAQRLTPADTLRGGDVLPGFEASVAELLRAK